MKDIDISDLNLTKETNIPDIDISDLNLTKFSDIPDIDISDLNLTKFSDIPDIDISDLNLEKAKPLNTAVDMLTSPFKKLADITTIENKPQNIEPSLRAMTTQEQTRKQTPEEQQINAEIEQRARDMQFERLGDKINLTSAGLDTQEQLDKLKKKQQYAVMSAELPVLAMTGGIPLAIAGGIEGIKQAKNLIVQTSKGEKYNPFDIRVLSELLPQNTPEYARLISSLAEMGTDVAVLGVGANMGRKFAIKNSVDTIKNKMSKAGYDQPTIDKVSSKLEQSIVERELGINPKNVIGEQQPPINIDEAIKMNIQARTAKIPPAVKTEPINVTPKTEPIKYNTSEEFVNNKIGTKIEIGDTDMVLGKQIKFIGKDATVDTHIRETPTEIYLNAIGTKKTGDMSSVLEKTGKGTEVINSLKEYADKTGKKLIIPDATNKAYPFWKKFNWLNEDYGVKIKLEDGKIYNPPNTFSYEPNTTNTITTTITTPNIETPEQSLMTEARKYKSADEFVNTRPSYFHSTELKNVDLIERQGFKAKVGERSLSSKGDMSSGVFLYDDIYPANEFGKNFTRQGKNPSVIETKVNGRVYDANTQTQYGWEDNLQIQEIASSPKIISQLKRDGYVGVTSTELGTNATFIFEPSSLKTKSQLIDIWNKANIETPAVAQNNQNLGVVEPINEDLASVSRTQIPTIGALPTESIKETDFKLYQRSLDLANKYKSGKIAESKYRPKKTLGVYYNNTKGKGNIYLKSLNNIEVVSHELVHDIDAQTDFTTNLMIDNSPTATQIKSELRKSYNDNYGLISKSHSKERKLQEGLAMVIQLSVVNPEYVAKNYPKALEFAMNNKILKEFRDEARQIIIDYEGLSAVDKIKSMGYSGIKPSGNGTNTFSKIIKAIKLWGDEQFFDSKARLDLLKEGDEIHSPVYFAGSVAKDIVTGVNGNNLTNKKGSFYVLDENGLPKNVYNENFYTLGEKIDKANSDFQEFLKIRTFYSMVKKRDTYIEGSEEYKNLDSILKKNTIPDKTIIDAYNTLNTQVNKDLAVIYDKLINLNIDTLETSRVITPEYAKELRDNWGYSPQNRVKYNEIVGDVADDSFKPLLNSKVNNLKKKTGSDLPIVDPYMATIKLMIATNQKAYRQIFNNMVLKVVDKYSDIMQVVPYKAGMEYDPTILMAKNPDGTNAPIQIDRQMKKTIDQIFEIVKPNIIEQLLLLPTQWFTKMTTGAYPLFPLVNIPVDQVTAFVNSRTGQIPFYTGLQTIIRMFKNPQLREYVNEYSDLFGLNSNTLLGTLEMDNFNFQKIRKNYNLIKMVDKYLTYPSNMSEFITRLTEYVRARHSGSSVAEAKRMANEVTGPFGDKGRWFGRIGQVLIKAIPFFNPTLQMARQSLRSLGRKGNRSKFFLTLLLATLLKVQGDKTILDSEDEEDRRAHIQLMAEQIAMYLYYSKKGNGLYKIKIDQTYLFVGALATMIYNSTKNGYHYNIADYVNAGTSFIPDQVNIFSALTDLMANKSFSGFERMAITSMPHLATIFTHMMFDKKTFPTVMNIVPQSLSRKEPYLQYNERTSDIAMYLGKELNISPIKLDDYFDTIFGRGSRLIVRGAEIASNTIRGKENKKNIKAIEGLNPFWQQTYPSSGRFTKKAYDIKNQVTQFKDTLKNNKDEMTPEKRQFVNKNKGLLLRFNLATKLYNKLNKGIRDGKIKDDTQTQIRKLKLEKQLFEIEQKLANKN